MPFAPFALLFSLVTANPSIAASRGNPPSPPAPPREPHVTCRLYYTTEYVDGSLDWEQEDYGAEMYVPVRSQVNLLGYIAKGGIVRRSLPLLEGFTDRSSGEPLPELLVSARYEKSQLHVELSDPFRGGLISRSSNLGGRAEVAIQVAGAGARWRRKALQEVRDLELSCLARP